MKSLLLCAVLSCALSSYAEESIYAKLQVDEVTENMLAVNPKLSLITQGEILINDGTVSLTLSKKMPDCPVGYYCPQIMPSTVTIQLNLTGVVQTECSTKYYAETPDKVESPLHEKVMVEDFSRTTCEKIIRSQGVITYIAAQMDETAAARFVVRGGFVRP